MEALFHKFVAGVAAIALSIGSFFGIGPTPTPLGASNAIETPVALFSTTLANSITSSATTMTLTSATTKDGTALASSTYSFIIDEGTASEEFVKADCTSTACTNMVRGISAVTGTTTVAALQKAHRRGASVKITDAPILLNITRIINGIGTFPNLVAYTSGTGCASGSSSTTLCNKGYVDNLANQGAATSTEALGGIVELGTLAEQASSYDGGSNKPTVLQTKNSTSTCQVVGSYNVVASTTTGKIDKGCIDQTLNYAWTGTNSFSQPLTLNSVAYTFPASQSASTYLKTDGSGNLSWAGIGNALATTTTQAFSTTQTSTTTIVAFTIPANTLSTANSLQCDFVGDRNGNGTVYVQSGASVTIEASYGGTSTTTAVFTQATGGAKASSDVYINMTSAGATNSQRITISSAFFNTGPKFFTGSSSTDSTTAQPFYVRVLSGASSYFAPDQVICSYVK